ncbi:MAG: hypothetical protein K9H64_03905 [Bacteroidales bacterium]|nr:hypothetical protein [Bacteroidales bacterium]MCF8454977.1 hypothetical protein [Bacteroidales bacterium]
MIHNIDVIYSDLIRPLPMSERLMLMQKILQDVIPGRIKSEPAKMRIKTLHKYRGIAKDNTFELKEDEWYKQ